MSKSSPQRLASWLHSLIEEEESRGQLLDETWYDALIDGLTLRMVSLQGLNPEGFRFRIDEQTKVSGTAEKRAEHFEDLAVKLASWPAELFEDPHTLGWIHEAYGEESRKKSFTRHIQGGERHRNLVETTRLYTPRWIADFLSQKTLQVFLESKTQGVKEQSRKEPPSYFDPAVGGGQMLLSALETLSSLVGPEEDLLSLLGGRDLDGQAVEITKRNLAIAWAKRSGECSPEIWEILDRQIQVGDGLSSNLPSADLVLANPPYMGWRSMPESLRERLKDDFRPFHHDLASAFIHQCCRLARGAVGILSQQSLWYLRRFEKARRRLLEEGRLTDYLHLGSGAFPNLTGEKASVVAFVYTGHKEASRGTSFWDLRNQNGELQQRKLRDSTAEVIDVKEFQKIPGMPLVHDLPKAHRALFTLPTRLDDIAILPPQNKTGKNRKYVVHYSALESQEIRECPEIATTLGHSEGHWVFYSKGGRFAPWWGNWDHLVDWSPDARQFYTQNRTSNLLGEQYWFQEGIVYTDFGGKRFAARWLPSGTLFDMTGPAIFPKEDFAPTCSRKEKIGFLMALLNGSVARRLLVALNPTLHFQVRDVRALPIPDVDATEIVFLSEKAWSLIFAIRDWNRHLGQDPSPDKPLKALIDPALLLRWEQELDAKVSTLYGVKPSPLRGASLKEHHQLSAAWSSESSK